MNSHRGCCGADVAVAKHRPGSAAQPRSDAFSRMPRPSTYAIRPIAIDVDLHRIAGIRPRGAVAMPIRSKTLLALCIASFSAAAAQHGVDPNDMQRTALP